MPIMEHLQKMLAGIMNNRMMAEGAILFHEGRPEDYLYLIHSGKVKQTKRSMEGKELTLLICQQGDLVGELSLYDHNATYTSTAIVIEEGEFGIIDKIELESLLSRDPHLMISFMKWFSNMNRKNQSKLRDYMLFGKIGALYSTLIRMSNSYGQNVEDGILIQLKLSNQELADFIGVARETLNRMVNDLKKANIISYEDGYITIHNIQYLKTFMECGDCPDDICRI